MTNELTQHHDMQTYLPLNPKTLNADQHAEALASLIFMVENRYGRIKVTSCADGSKQRIIPGYKK